MVINTGILTTNTTTNTNTTIISDIEQRIEKSLLL